MSSQSILIIEDNKDVRENLQEILELYGYAVYAEPDGLAGVKTAIRNPPDLVLCDVMMPELDGFGVLNLLSENERTAAIPFIFISARTESEDIRRGMNLGADDYITKPFYKDELLNVIRTRLRKAALRTGGAPATVPEQMLSNPEAGRRRLERAFREAGRQHSLEQGQTLVREGDHPHFIYFVEAGHIHLSRTHEYGRDYIIAEVGPGEIFGVPSALERSTLHYTATAASAHTSVLALPVDQLLKLFNADRTVTEALIHLLAGRVMSSNTRLVNQAYDSVRRRTALVLCDLHEKYAGANIELSREELAQMVGSTKESVIRALSDFKREGLVVVRGKEVKILEPERLRGLLV